MPQGPRSGPFSRSAPMAGYRANIVAGFSTNIDRDGDFERLGVSLGHMRKLQAAMVALSLEEPPTGEVAPSTPERQPAEAERRQLTVMFRDLVGSTALSQKLECPAIRLRSGKSFPCACQF